MRTGNPNKEILDHFPGCEDDELARRAKRLRRELRGLVMFKNESLESPQVCRIVAVLDRIEATQHYRKKGKPKGGDAP